MKRTSMLSLVALIAAGVTPAAAQVKIGGLVQVWYNQVLDSNLRTNSATLGTTAGNRSYYNLRSEFKENGFAIRRTELKFSGKIVDDVEYEVMIDPSINTSAGNPTILQDAVITYKSSFGLDFKVGQMKIFQTYEGLNSSSELLLVERSQMGRTLGDVRNRGAAAILNFGDPKDFGGRFVLGAFNGSPLGVDKGNDNNAQKDFVARLDFTAAKDHKFGVYTLQGSTNSNDKTGAPLVATTFTNADPAKAPTAAQVLDNKDKTTNLGAYYIYQTADLHASVEYISGLLGRRFATVANAAGAAGREHLDQKFQGIVLTGAYTFGSHTLIGRYDVMNYNAGDQWYTVNNPYTTTAAGTSIIPAGTTGAVDYTPKYTELTLGYLYAFKPETLKAANIKVNYISRSKNFLAPLAAAGQNGEQGGNNLVVAFQIAF
ncbi:MAG TPA: porin [Holophagaceae bacterium]|nr:porin [Holophagaceae bacterium]